ncbi:MAG: SNF2-related protein [Beijerinckiaceae bacterium]
MSRPIPIVLTRQSVVSATGQRAFEAGAAYLRDGRVIQAERVSDSEILSAVRGSERTPYRQTITLDGAVIDGACTCPVGHNCKHVAAAMLKLLAQSTLVVGGADATASPSIQANPGKKLLPAGAAIEPAISLDLRSWLSRVEEAAARDALPIVAISDDLQRVIYVLSSEKQRGKRPVLGVRVLIGNVLKTGEISSAPGRVASLDMAFQSRREAFLLAEDVQIFRLLAWSRNPYGSVQSANRVVLAGDPGLEVLDAMLATGRARHRKINGPLLSRGPDRPAHFVWREDDDGVFSPDLIAPEGTICQSIDPALYFDKDSSEIGLLDAGLPQAQVAALLAAPPVSAAAAVSLRRAMGKAGPALAALAPPLPAPVEEIVATPVPHLALTGLEVSAVRREDHYGSGWGRRAPPLKEQIGVARVRFVYPENVVVPLGETRPVIRQRVNGRLLAVVRNLTFEGACFGDLQDLGLDALELTRIRVPKGHEDDLEPIEGQEQWIDLLLGELPDLPAKGWRIDIDDSFPVRIVRASGDMSMRIGEAVRDASGIDWFALDCGVMVDGVAVDLTEAIVELIRTRSGSAGAMSPLDDGRSVVLPLPDGRLLACPADRMNAMIAGLMRLFDGAPLPAGKAGPLRLRASQGADLADLETATAGLGVAWMGAEKLRALGRALSAAMTDGGSLPHVPSPPGFLASLRPYQQIGLNWLGFLRGSGFGAVLADDMGLGKTIQTLALLAAEKAAGRLDRPALVVAPTSLLGNWRREAAHFAPDLKVMVSEGSDRRNGFGAFAHHDLVITSYPLVSRDHEVLAGVDWSVLVLDEAQVLKNPDAGTTRRIDGLKADWRLALSGTPVQNNLSEIWSLFHLINKGLLGERKTFESFYRKPIEKKGDAPRAALLARRIRPFILRRTKAEVARDLPPKTEITETVQLEGAQRDLYETIRLAMQKKVRDALARQGLARSHIIVLDALLKLRQASLDPRLLKEQGATAQAGSAKLRRLMELLAILIDEQRRVVVFSQFTGMLDLIEEQLAVASISFVRLDGQSRNRTELTQLFQDGDAPVFLVSLKAGGVGLNLTAADTVILFDPWWNPAVEDQAIDRVHRIGQGKPVFVHRLVAEGTVEEKMEALKTKKRKIAAALFDADGQITGNLTEADLEELLG